MSEKIIKYVGILFIVTIIFSIFYGYNGGASYATKNYHKVMAG